MAYENPHTHIDAPRIVAALTGLQRAYPLERRIQQEACDTTRETYFAVLLRWVHSGVAPCVDGFDLEALDELIALDALQAVGGRISCPPFSGVPTDTQVHFPHVSVSALSALDALALPRLLDTAATIDTRCAISGEPICFMVTDAGDLHADDHAVSVAFQKVASHITRYALDLAPGIRFVLTAHANASRQTLTLAEAATVANAFYAFQRGYFATTLSKNA